MIQRHWVDAGIAQGSPMSPIVCAIHASALIQWVEEKVSRVEDLSFDEEVVLVWKGCDLDDVVRKLEVCASMSIDCTDSREWEFDTTIAEVALFICRQGPRK